MNKMMMKKTFILATLSLLTLNGCAALLPISVVTTTLIASDERSLGVILDDKMIISRIRSELMKFGTSFLQVHLEVLEGRVLITGTVPSHDAAKEVLKIVWSVKGVREVLNELVVSLKSLDSSTNDTLIEKSIEGLLLVEKDLISANYRIAVNNNKVYLLGIAQNEKERDKALKVARQAKGVEKVINYIILKNDIRRG